jgi:Helix-turn-helix domain
LSQPDVSRLLRGHFRDFSLERLLRLLERVRGLGRTAAADWLGEPPEPADRPVAEDPEPTASAPGSERPRAALAAAS